MPKRSSRNHLANGREHLLPCTSNFVPESETPRHEVNPVECIPGPMAAKTHDEKNGNHRHVADLPSADQKPVGRLVLSSIKVKGGFLWPA
jgi:hypothetical protein